MRKTRTVVIPPATEGKETRDAGKVFILTEMPAMQAEKWGLRALMALGSSGITVPQELADAGIIGVALLGYQVFMGAKFDEVEPLMDEMMQCVQYRAGENVLMPFSQFGISTIEEPSTMLVLREQLMELHTGFTLAEVAQRLKAAVSARQALS